MVVTHLKELHEQENYFKLQDYFTDHRNQLSEKDNLYFTAITKNSFNQHHQSNISINELLKGHSSNLNEQEVMCLHKTKFMNHYNLYEYNNAYKECTLLINRFKPIMDSVKYVQLHNDLKIVNALRDAPEQEIIKLEDSRITMKRDKLGLLNVSLNMQGDSLDFLFDTGSSFSFIKRGIAEKYGLKIFDIDLEVEGATGTPVICDLTMIPSFTLANIVVKNAVFWVFDDKDLTLPQYDYSLNGALGFPISRAMEEIQLVFDDELFIPRVPSEYNYKNLAMDDLDPVIAILHNNDTLPYYFDTGAAFSSLYKPYYEKNSIAIDSTYDKHSFDIGSIGGLKEFTCYIIDSIQLELAGKSAWIYDVETHTEYIYKDVEKVYGNLGQDFILQFKRMIISTKYGSVLFE